MKIGCGRLAEWGKRKIKLWDSEERERYRDS